MRGGIARAALALCLLAPPIGILVTATPARAESRPTWIERTPQARGRHAVAYDAARGRSVLFGGLREGVLLVTKEGLLDDTWEWDGNS